MEIFFFFLPSHSLGLSLLVNLVELTAEEVLWRESGTLERTVLFEVVEELGGKALEIAHYFYCKIIQKKIQNKYYYMRE